VQPRLHLDVNALGYDKLKALIDRGFPDVEVHDGDGPGQEYLTRVQRGKGSETVAELGGGGGGGGADQTASETIAQLRAQLDAKTAEEARANEEATRAKAAAAHERGERAKVQAELDEKAALAERANAAAELERSERKKIEAATQQVVWECEAGGNGEWICFDSSVSDQIEAAYESKGPVRWKQRGYVYEVNWVSMVQINTSTKKPRSIQRRLVTRKTDVSANDSSHGAWKSKATSLGDGDEYHTISAPAPGTEQEDSRDLREFNFATGNLSALWSSVYGGVYGGGGGGGGSNPKPTKVEVYDCPAVRKRWEAKKSDFGGQQTPIWVFHGTDAGNIQSIMKDGFKVGGPSGTAPNGSTFGAGVYTANGPNTPLLKYGRGQCVILAKAVLGHSVGTHGALGGDSWRPQADWVVFKESAQLLPVYAIYF